jgi:hypothetical protein
MEILVRISVTKAAPQKALKRRAGVRPANTSLLWIVDYLPILNILVPQVGQIPCVAGLPFFIVTCAGLFISLLALHFTQ